LLNNKIIAQTSEIIEIDLTTSDDPSPPPIPETEEYIEIREPLDTQINTFASATPSTENNYTPLETTKNLSEELSDLILEAWERNAEIAPNPVIPDQYNYSPEEDDFHPPPSYSPVVYEELDTPAIPLAVPQIEVEIPLATFETFPTNSDSDEYPHIPPEVYNCPREE